MTITGITDDGSGNTPMPDAVCRFLLASGAEANSDTTDANGAFQLVVAPDTRGHIVCSPRSSPSLSLTTFSSTRGFVAGERLESENVTPGTTVVADVIRHEDPAEPERRKAELLNEIVTGQNPNLDIVVAMAERLYRAMYARQINTAFGADDRGNGGDGDGGGDGGGASGDAGDGADFSPLAQATCEFVVGDGLTNSEQVSSSALADFIADGVLDRPDLAAVADEVNAGADPAEVQNAFAAIFPDGLGRPVATQTDDTGRYELPIPPGMTGYIRCFPKDRQQLVLGAYFPGRAAGETLTGQDVDPASTVFATDIAPVLTVDLATVLENYRADIDGLLVLLSGPNLPAGPLDPDGITLGTSTLPENRDAGLVAFAVTALFNALNKNGFDLDFLAAIAELRQNDEVTPAFLEAQGVPAGETQALAALINGAITAAAGTLGTDLATAWSTGRINVTVMEGAEGSLVPDATLNITNTDLTCSGCNSQTDANGQLTLAVSGLGKDATEVEVAVSGVPGFETTLATAQAVAFATVDLDVSLTTPGRDAQAPTITITAPSGGTATTSNGSLDIQGTAADDGEIAAVNWSNDRGGSGVCEGTTDWRASGVPLQAGVNIITVTAIDTAGNESTDTLTVTYIQPDTTPPSVAFTSPTTGGAHDTNSDTLDIAGTAADDEALGQVRWVNDRGGSGVCEGTTSWSAGAIPLQTGDNIITVTAEDMAGNTATVSLTVTYEPLYRLTIRGSGSGSGSVSDANLGINCSIDAGTTSGTCSGRYPGGTAVNLDIDPSNSSFDGWSGACTGNGDCSFTLSRDRTVTATLTRRCGEGEISIRPDNADFADGGGTGSFSVSAPDDCVWTASESETWITLTNPSGTGDGTVRYRVDPNNSTATRAGVISVSGHGHTVSQTWSDFIGDWNAAASQEGEIYRVLITDNQNSGLTVQPYYWCDGGPYCEVNGQTVSDPNGGPISYTASFYEYGGTTYRETVTLTLISRTSLQARREITTTYTTGSGTVTDVATFDSNLGPN